MSELEDTLKAWGLGAKSIQLFKDNGFDLDTLNSCHLEDLGDLLDSLPLADGIRFRRNFKTKDVTSALDVVLQDPGLETLLETFISQPGTSAATEDSPSIKGKSRTPKSKKKEGTDSPLRRSPRQQAKQREESFKRSLFSEDRTIACHKSLEAVLKKDAKGHAVLTLYNHRKELSDKDRSVISNIVISLELAESEEKTITTPRFTQLRNIICRLFPTETENQDIWFTPYNNVGVKEIRAGGKLLELYYNTRKVLIDAGVIVSKRKKGKKSKQPDDPNVSADTIESLSDADKAKIQYLKGKSVKSLSTAKLYWNETADFRKKECETLKIHDIFAKYPVLGTKHGPELLKSDFIRKYKDSEHTLFVQWPTFKENFISYVKTNLKNSHFGAAVKTLGINLDEKDDDLSTVYVARLLAYHLNKTTTTGGLTKEDAVDGFICVVKSDADVVLKIEERRAKFEKINRQVQPSPIIVVNNVPEVVASYAVINNVFFVATSPIDAIDVCFKAYHALNAFYPQEAKVAWQFVQKHLFNLKTEFDENLANERKLQSNLLQFQLTISSKDSQ